MLVYPSLKKILNYNRRVRNERQYSKLIKELVIKEGRPITVSFTVPCYNSANYMDTCITSLLACGTDIEIIIIDDGSTDRTAEIADMWVERHPDIISVIHKENGGHGSGVNAGLAVAKGLYFKVVDSDDWLDYDAMRTIMTYLRSQNIRQNPTDLVIANYVYEKMYNNKRQVMRNKAEYPIGREFTWKDTKHIIPGKYLHMHSTIFRTQLLRDANMVLPENCFYVDNLYVYHMLPHVKTMFYVDANMYRYFIGREGQSVNEAAMLQRIDQHIHVTREMIKDTGDVDPVKNPKLFAFMGNHLAMMMVVCSVFLRMTDTEEDDKKLADMWEFLHYNNEPMFRHVQRQIWVLGTNIPGRFGRWGAVWGYRQAQKLFSFN